MKKGKKKEKGQLKRFNISDWNDKYFKIKVKSLNSLIWEQTVTDKYSSFSLMQNLEKKTPNSELSLDYYTPCVQIIHAMIIGGIYRIHRILFL